MGTRRRGTMAMAVVAATGAAIMLARPSAANDLYNARFCGNLRETAVFYIFQVQRTEEDKRNAERQQNLAEIDKNWKRADEFKEAIGRFDKQLWDLYPRLSYITGLYNGMGCQSRPQS